MKLECIAGLLAALLVSPAYAQQPTLSIAAGSIVLASNQIASGTCAPAQTPSAPGVITTDVVTLGFSFDPTALTGYVPSTNGMLTIIAWPNTNSISIKVCNNTGSAVSPLAVTLNWKVVR